MSEEKVRHFINLVHAELDLAISDWPPFQDKHEAYAHILEELDELWDSIKDNDGTEVMLHEAVQVAAMAIRFCVDSANFPH